MRKTPSFRKFAALFLAMSIVLCSVNFCISADALSGEGTAENPYLISDEEQLCAFADAVNDGKNASAYVVLEDDITVSGSWTPIGSTSVFPFKGTFDGNGHTVTITVDTPNLSYFGFFGCLENAAVKNLTVNGEVYCSEPYRYVGGIAARARGNVTIENCVNNAFVSSNASAAGIGGIAGGYDDGVEYVFENIRLCVNNTVNNGNILVTGEYNAFAGGIVGLNKNCVQLESCENNGIIYAPGICAGGLLGESGSTTGDYSPLISNCSSNGIIIAAEGKVGRLYGKGTIAKKNIINSGDNVYDGKTQLDGSILLEAEKYSNVITVAAETQPGQYLNLLKSGKTADDSITAECSQGEKDIKKGYIEFDENGAKLAAVNETGAVVRETATLKLTDADGVSARKPIVINLLPGGKNARRELMDNIANTYAGKSGEWVVFDMAVYEKMGFGENTTDKDNYRNLAVNTLAGTNPLSVDRAKAEIIFAALDTDTENLTTVDGVTYSNAQKLAEMNLGSSHYSAPWILLAEEAGQVKLSGEQRNAMISLLSDNQGENGLFYWSWGTEKGNDVDTTGTAIAALARFYGENDTATAVIDRAIAGLSAVQGENGSFGNINSDAMVITGLAAMGINPASDERFVKSASLADAVMLYVNDARNGFTTTYVTGTAGEKAKALATEQGFRALIVLEQMKKCSAFNVYTQNIKGVTTVKRLNSYTATDEGTPEETEEESGGGSSGSDEKTGISVTLEVTANNDKWLSVTANAEENVTLEALLKAELEKAGITADIKDGYLRALTKDGKTLEASGTKSGWMYKVNGEIPEFGIADCKLKDGDSVVLFYTEDYTKEPGTKGWSGGSGTISSGNTKSDVKTEPVPEATAEYKNPYGDVSDSEWYYDCVKYVTENKIMNGVSDSEFAPDDTVTRAMFVTILFRMENEPVVNFALMFADVLPAQWYTEAVRWAASEKIVSGTDENTFGTDDPITREQMAAIIYRYAKYKNIDTTEAENTNILSYEDYSDISEYAIPALQYASGAGIMTGKTDKTINPSDTSTRAEAAAVIMRILNK